MHKLATDGIWAIQIERLVKTVKFIKISTPSI